MKKYIPMVLVALVVMAAVSRVPALRKPVTGTA